MTERFKVNVFALCYAMEVGHILESIESCLQSAVRAHDPMVAAFKTREAGRKCGQLKDRLRALERSFIEEIPMERPQLRAVGEK